MSKPKIRFKGYKEDWEQRKYAEVIELLSGQDFNPEEYNEDGIGIPYLTGASCIENGCTTAVRWTEKPRCIAEKGDTVLVCKGSGYGTIATVNQEKAHIARQFMALKVKKHELDNRFNYFLLNSVVENIKTDARGLIAGIARDAVLKQEIVIPCLNEQTKIGEYFENLDRLITLHQRKCEETKKLKKYMLQKMFPQNGKRVPEIRFAGFTDDWEQRKFGNVTELKSASRVHKEEWTTSGVPFYRSSDVMAAINGTENEKAYISEALYEKLSSISGKLEAGDVLVTGGGSVGKPYIVPNNEPLYTKDADLLWIKNQGKFHPYFLYEFFFTPTFRSYLSSISHVGTIAHYTITQLSETPICLPSVGEQQKIGDYFYNIDHLITLHQRKYEELQKIKKFMLQNMFI